MPIIAAFIALWSLANHTRPRRSNGNREAFFNSINYFPPPALVNALDYLVAEWTYKPAGLVSYGGVSGGLRAAQAIKLLLTTLKIMPIPEGVAVPSFQ